MRIFLIRHGESTSDVEDRYGGHYNDHLTARGASQAGKIAKKLTGEKIEIIFSSPFHRARETAGILAKEWKCPVKPVEELKERDRYAHLTGMKKAVAAKKHPQHVASLKTYLHEVEGGETYDSFKKRILKTFEDLAGSPHGTLAVVCHGGPIGCILRELKMGETRYIGKCAWFEIEKNNGFHLIKMENAELEKRKN